MADHYQGKKIANIEVEVIGEFYPRNLEEKYIGLSEFSCLAEWLEAMMYFGLDLHKKGWLHRVSLVKKYKSGYRSRD